jgi:hypothetical protein
MTSITRALCAVFAAPILSAVDVFAVCYTAARLRPALFLAVAVLISGCSSDPGPRMREIERFSELSDEEIDKAKADCHLIATTDYNCADLIPAAHGMSVQEWEDLSAKTKLCRKSQRASYNACLRGRGVRYSEFR